MPKSLSGSELQTEAAAFRDQFRTVLLATTSEEGNPDASYAPYVADESGSVFILVSELAQHTKNIFANPVVSLMWIEDENNTRNPFARKRLILNAQPHRISRTNREWKSVIENLTEQFGKTIELLTSLPDFHLIRFDIKNGNYVRGFGQAFEVTGNKLLINPERRTS